MKNHRKQMKSISRISGFTLVETLVALSIFSVSVLAVISLLGTSITNTDYAKQKIIASYLAEEGIEYVRNMRDTFVLSASPTSAGWGNFLTKMSPCDATYPNTTQKCYFDSANLFSGGASITNIPLTACSGSCQTNLYQSNTDGYDYNVSGVKTDFIREIKIERVTSDEIKVSSTVRWSQQSGPFSITFSEELFNWIE